MRESSEKICKPLPHEVTKQASTSDNREQFILDFLKTRMPNTDIKDISVELNKTFLFDKVKSKVEKVKPKRKTFLSARKRKLIGIKTIGLNNQLKYKDFLPLNQLWLEYILKALEINDFSRLPVSPVDPQWEAMNLKLMRADFHGAEIAVVRSTCPSLVGIKGMMIQETKNAFRIIGKDNIVRTIPKAVVAVEIFLVGVKLELFGKEFCIRPAERCVRKFKAIHTAEL